MFEKLCPECGAAEYITGEHRWLDNGDIVMARNEQQRTLFLETESFTPLIRNIEEIIGTSVERIVITAMRRATRMYCEHLLPEGVSEKVRKGELSLKAIHEVFAEIGRVMGYGNYRFVDYRYEQDENDFVTVSITEPYCLPMCMAAHSGSIEAILECDHDVTCKEVSPGLYHITAFPAEHPEELEGRVILGLYNHKNGDLELERCVTCGGPKALSDYQWHMDRGVILNKLNQRRIAMVGPHELEPVFRELEAELGETIPLVVVEAQRRFAKTGYYSPDDVKDEDELRTQLAFKGFGNLLRFKMGKRGLSMRLDNATLHLLIVGMMQGIFDMAFDTDSSVEWELSEEGNLEVEVRPTA